MKKHRIALIILQSVDKINDQVKIPKRPKKIYLTEKESTEFEAVLKKEGNQDPRVVRTRQMLLDALMALVEKKPFAKLSVTEITRTAGLDRSTFYLHYSGIHALLEDLSAFLFDELRSEIIAQGQVDVNQDPKALEAYVLIYFSHLDKYQKFYKRMLGKQGDPCFKSLFQSLLAELLFEPIADKILQYKPASTAELFLQFYTSGFSGIAAWWLDKDMPIPAMEAAQIVTRNILPAYLALERSSGKYPE